MTLSPKVYTARIQTLKNLQRFFNRTEFKAIFALAVSPKSLTQDDISERTGLGKRFTSDIGLHSLIKFNIIKADGSYYSYNDNHESWSPEFLKRDLYTQQTK